MWRREQGEDWGKVDVAKEEVEREESKSYHVLWMIAISTEWTHKRKLYLEWSPTSDVFEYVIKVLYDFILGFHYSCLLLTFDV